MPRGVNIYLAVTLVASWALAAGSAVLHDSLPKSAQPWANALFLGTLIVPFITAWVLHRQQAAGNPFAGLTWGPTSWYFLLYFGPLLAGAAVVGALVAIGAAGFDPQMSGYIQQTKDMLAAQGTTLPPGAEGQLSIGGWFIAIGMPILLPSFGAALGCLGSFPQLGWLTRRRLVKGRLAAWAILTVYTVAATASAGLIVNPQLGELGVPLRCALYALYALASIPLTLWVFYRTRSAVLPMVAAQSFGAGYMALTPFLTDAPQWLAAPQIGIAQSLGNLLLGVALWVWKDPGGQDLAVAAVAQDGTPLTPAMLQQAQAYTAQHAASSNPESDLPAN